MFTGLIEHVATVASIEPSTDSSEHLLTLANAAPVLGDCHVGDSICVNGACLTVREFTPDSFVVGLANETLERTNLGKLVVGDGVNCERAMAAHTRFGGHMVQGHVDATASIVSIAPDGSSLRYTFALPDTPAARALMAYLVEKGYVTVDGASLTLTHVDDARRQFGIMLIEHSQARLTLTHKKPGDTVNIEADCVGKYILGPSSRLEAVVARLVDARLRAAGINV
ncbi:Riboflavin synthase alpha chain [Cryptotrichosporon argae]